MARFGRRHNPVSWHNICAQRQEIMDLFQGLETFARVTEMGSFSAVAKAKNSSHSAVTRLIGQLETHFGVRLFHRTTRRLSLTEDGQDLLAFARNLLDVVEGMEGMLGSHRTAPTGLVRIGTTPALTTRNRIRPGARSRDKTDLMLLAHARGSTTAGDRRHQQPHPGQYAPKRRSTATGVCSRMRRSQSTDQEQT
jgi:hypothetical protein